MKENEMSLIDRYITEIGKHLPHKNRADIQAEIRSTLEDMLDERKQVKGDVDEAMVVELLKEYGAPHEVASRYQTQHHQYLIGPRMFPIFALVARVVFSVLVALSLISLGVDLSKAGFAAAEIVPLVSKWFISTLSGLIAALGHLVLILAIIDRTAFGRNFEQETKEWNPRELYSTPDPDQIDPPDHIATIIFTFLGLVILNLYPNLVSIHVVNNGIQTSIPILTKTFFHFLPWVNLMSLVLIGFNAIMLSQRIWRTTTRILSMLIDVAAATLSITILQTPGILGITPEALNTIGLSESANELARLANSIPTLVIAIVTIVTIIKVVVTSRRLLQDKPKSPYPILK
jgi:hypothetical protein